MVRITGQQSAAASSQVLKIGIWLCFQFFQTAWANPPHSSAKELLGFQFCSANFAKLQKNPQTGRYELKVPVMSKPALPTDVSTLWVRGELNLEDLNLGKFERTYESMAGSSLQFYRLDAPPGSKYSRLTLIVSPVGSRHVDLADLIRDQSVHEVLGGARFESGAWKESSRFRLEKGLALQQSIIDIKVINEP